MKTRYLIAAILIGAAFIIHAIGGESTDIKSLLLSGIPENIKLEFRAVWHMLSIDFLISAIFMAGIIKKHTINQNHNLVHFIGIRMILYGFLFLGLILFSNASLLLQVPQWILLLGIGTLLEWDWIRKPEKN